MQIFLLMNMLFLDERSTWVEIVWTTRKHFMHKYFLCYKLFFLHLSYFEIFWNGYQNWWLNKFLFPFNCSLLIKLKMLKNQVLSKIWTYNSIFRNTLYNSNNSQCLFYILRWKYSKVISCNFLCCNLFYAKLLK